MQSDPRLICARVDELSAAIQDWEHRCGATFESADEAIRQSGELIQRALAVSMMVFDDAGADEAAVKQVAANSESVRERCEVTAKRALAAAGESDAVVRAARSAVAHWQGEAAAANTRVQSAIRAEQDAQATLAGAESALSGAQAQLQNAAAALEAARHRVEHDGKDAQGRAKYRPADTSAEVAAVAHARERVSQCETHVATAQAALAAAEAERAAARLRLDACVQAVRLAREGEQSAAAALESARAASIAAERTLEELHRGDLVVAKLRSLAQEGIRAAEMAAGEVGLARGSHTAAAQQHSLARDLYESARQRSCHYRLEMSWRLDQLRAFDQPIHEL